jgi:hypothetical protein
MPVRRKLVVRTTQPSHLRDLDSASERILVILALVVLTSPTQAHQAEQVRTKFECAITKIIMTNKLGS